MANRIPVLTFHALDDRPGPLGVPPSLFADAMERWAAAGIATIGLGPVVNALRTGTPFPPRSVVLTFDDGYRSLVEHAAPVLERLGFTAVLFAVAGTAGGGSASDRLPIQGGREMLSWGEVDMLCGRGWEVGAHTVTHADLRTLPPGKQGEELAASKDGLEQRLGRPVRWLAYPYGRFTAHSVATARRLFDGACTTRLALVDGRSDPFRLERVDAFYLKTPGHYEALWTTRSRVRLAARRAARGVRERWSPGPG